MLGRMLNLVALLMILGLGLTTALFRADTIRRSKTDSRHTDLAIRAYGESDGERSQQLLKVFLTNINIWQKR